jgi:hypothetical protein
MSNSNKVKSDLLGEAFGTANNKLKKSILFHMAKMLDMDTCYRCSNKIETVAEFSIEHKESWMRAESAVEAFYDLNNIAFSHISCNIAASYKHRIYASKEEQRKAGFDRYWAKPEKREQHNLRRREKLKMEKEMQ